MYDTMHNCGCYHMFFPASKLVRKKIYGVYQEVPLVPQVLDGPNNSRPVLRFESGSHYLQKVYFRSEAENKQASNQYLLQGYDNLRSLPYGKNKRRSLFSWDGIVNGTERSERWILWPMGVPEPGAMRQWGRHATAFIGKRHFDDAFMFERYFANK